MNPFRPNPLVARWLLAEPETPGGGQGIARTLRGSFTSPAGERSRAEPASAHASPDWDKWLLRRMCSGEVIDVGGVLVDRAVLRQRFACVSDRCAPGPARGRYRSCCADAFVALSGPEDRRLASRGGALLAFMQGRERRLHACHGPSFYRHSGELGLARPGARLGERCVFSKLDGKGRIRCHLHAYAKQARLDRGKLQPISCRLFPLILLDCGDGRVLLTLVASHTRRLVSAYPPNRYPCLDDPSLPPLHESMRGDLDWLFGKGFARALSTAAAGIS